MEPRTVRCVWEERHLELTWVLGGMGKLDEWRSHRSAELWQAPKGTVDT